VTTLITAAKETTFYTVFGIYQAGSQKMSRLTCIFSNHSTLIPYLVKKTVIIFLTEIKLNIVKMADKH